MKNFAWFKAGSVNEAISSLGSDWNECAVMAGGTDLLGEMKDYIYSPERVVSIKAIADTNSIFDNGSEITIGATTVLSVVTDSDVIKNSLPALHQAAGHVASPQIRNAGTIGGNVCQRPRCWYYRDHAVNCRKKGGSTCFAMVGKNKYHAIMGGGPCYIVHPSDTAVALSAYEAKFSIEGKNGKKTVDAKDFFVLPKDDISRENILGPGDILTGFSMKKPDSGTKAVYMKVQERDAWDFALASVAVVMKMNGSRCDRARIVLGAAAPVPWRVEAAEKELEGKTVNADTAQKAGEAAVAERRVFRDNRYKIDMFTNLVKKAVLSLT